MRKFAPFLAALIPLSAAAFDLQGHRGARGLAPENTLPAFAAALSTGVSTLELDAGVTRDGVVEIAHDRHLNPDITRDASGRWLDPPGPTVRSLTLAELPEAVRLALLKEASRYASGKLCEVESRAHLVHELHDTASE